MMNAMLKTPVVIPTKKDKIKINLLKEGPIDLETEIMEIVILNNIKNIKTTKTTYEHERQPDG